VDTDPHSIVEWAEFVDVGSPESPNVIAARIRGDGRVEDGTSSNGAPSRSQGEFWGVRAKIWQGGSGHLVFSPAFDKEVSECEGLVRTLGFDLGTGLVQVNTFTNARNLRDLSVGEVRVQNMPFDHVKMSACESFRFRADSADGAEIASQTVSARLPDLPGVQESDGAAAGPAGRRHPPRDAPAAALTAGAA
jgi:hypothetical protein